MRQYLTVSVSELFVDGLPVSELFAVEKLFR